MLVLGATVVNGFIEVAVQWAVTDMSDHHVIGHILAHTVTW